MILYEKPYFCANLSFVYRMIVASAPLLRFAEQRTDGVLADYYRRHLEEETDHDAMLLADLKRLGVDVVPRFHMAAEIAGSQYYLIAHDQPALLLGYMLALESNAMPLDLVDDLERHYGVELSCLRHHAEHDPAHKRDLLEMISGQSGNRRAGIAWNHDCVIRALNLAFDSLGRVH